MEQHNYPIEANKYILDTDPFFLVLCSTEIYEIIPNVLTSKGLD